MNIFNALSSRGDNQLRETNLSAILAYFLDPAQDHGLSVCFLQAFLKLAGIEPPSGVNLHGTYVETEQPQEGKKGKMRLDVVVELRNKNDDTLHYLVVENKIKKGAENAKQIVCYYGAKRNEVEDGGEKITMIFLTPATDSAKMKEEYENLKLSKVSEKDGDDKVWLHWSSDESGVQTVQTTLREIIRMESAGEISPINEYAKHTLKAFAVHLDTLSPPSDSGKKRTAASWEEVDSVSVQIPGGQFTVVQTKGGVYVLDSNGEKVVAKPVLRKINDHKKLGVRLFNSTGKTKKDTRQLGLDVMKALYEKGAA